MRSARVRATKVCALTRMLYQMFLVVMKSNSGSVVGIWLSSGHTASLELILTQTYKYTMRSFEPT